MVLTARLTASLTKIADASPEADAAPGLTDGVAGEPATRTGGHEDEVLGAARERVAGHVDGVGLAASTSPYIPPVRRLSRTTPLPDALMFAPPEAVMSLSAIVQPVAAAAA